jgi:hypothetical protein
VGFRAGGELNAGPGDTGGRHVASTDSPKTQGRVMSRTLGFELDDGGEVQHAREVMEAEQTTGDAAAAATQAVHTTTGGRRGELCYYWN